MSSVSDNAIQLQRLSRPARAELSLRSSSEAEGSDRDRVGPRPSQPPGLDVHLRDLRLTLERLRAADRERGPEEVIPRLRSVREALGRLGEGTLPDPPEGPSAEPVQRALQRAAALSGDVSRGEAFGVRFDPSRSPDRVLEVDLDRLREELSKDAGPPWDYLFGPGDGDRGLGLVSALIIAIDQLQRQSQSGVEAGRVIDLHA